MSDRKPPAPSPDHHDGGPSPLVMPAVVVVLIVGGYFLAVKLKTMSQMQDCVMSGRTNCAAIVTPGQQ